MRKLSVLIFLMILTLVNHQAHAQNLTGSWEGRLGSEVLQINIEQNRGALCGYTYDIEIDDENSFCSAKFTGTYLLEERKWYLQGYEFITRSGSHVLMNIKLWFDPEDSPGVLRASVTHNDVSFFMHDFASDVTLLVRKRKKPIPYPGQRGSCFDETPKKPSPERNNIPIIPKKPIAPVAPPKKDSVKIIIPKKPEAPKQDTIKIPIPKKIAVSDSSAVRIKNMEARKNSEQSRLVIHSKTINLKLFDNGIVDGDSISVFYNGKLLVSNQRLSDKAIELNITLDEKAKTHKITLYAENLGEIPPNTALIIVTAGNQRFELRSKASLEENAVLIFEYAPQ